MQTASLITQVLTVVDNIPNPASGAHAGRRARYLAYAQEGMGELWLDPKELSWTRKDGTVAIAAAGSSGLLPTDFRKLGRDGTVWAPGDQDDPMEARPAAEIQRLQQSAFRTSTPAVYAIFGQDPTTRRGLLQVPVASGAYTLTLRAYLARVPTLADTDSDSGLDQFPEDLANLYMMSYLRWRGLDDRGDKRADKWERRKDQVREAIRKADMGAENTVQTVPAFYDEDDGGMY